MIKKNVLKWKIHKWILIKKEKKKINEYLKK